jgi:hypothetical protein
MAGTGMPPGSTSSATSAMLPLMIVAEGTNEIQRNVIARQLVAPGGVG